MRMGLGPQISAALWGSPEMTCYNPLVMTNIAMEKTYKWRFLAGKIIYKWAIFTNQLTNLWLFNIAMEMAHRNR